jgi:hypothetical protein
MGLQSSVPLELTLDKGLKVFVEHLITKVVDFYLTKSTTVDQVLPPQLPCTTTSSPLPWVTTVMSHCYWQCWRLGLPLLISLFTFPFGPYVNACLVFPTPSLSLSLMSHATREAKQLPQSLLVRMLVHSPSAYRSIGKTKGALFPHFDLVVRGRASLSCCVIGVVEGRSYE